MKDLPETLRALADFLERPELEGVKAYTFEVVKPGFWEVAWCEEVKPYFLRLSCNDGAGRIEWIKGAPGGAFDPTAETLPPDLLGEFGRLRG